MGISDQMWRVIPLLLIVVAVVLLHGGGKFNPTQALSFLGIGGAAAALNCRGSDSFFCYARRCGQCEDDAVRWQEMLRAAEAALHGDDVAVKEDCNVEVVDLSAPGATATWRELQRSTKPLLVRGGMAAEWAQRLSQELSTEQQHVLGSLLHQPRVNSEAIKAALLFRLLQGEAYGGERLQLRENSPFSFMYGVSSGLSGREEEEEEEEHGAARPTMRGLINELLLAQHTSAAGSAQPFEAFSLGETELHRSVLPVLCNFSEAPTLSGSVSLGGARSGVAWHHSHGRAALALLAGRKRWYLAPPEDPPSLELQWSMPWQWLSLAARTGGKGLIPNPARRPRADAHPPQLSGAQQWCTQRPGEVMLVPRVWWHATLNARETIGLGCQLRGGTNSDAETAPQELPQPIEELRNLLMSPSTMQAQDLVAAEEVAREICESQSSTLYLPQKIIFGFVRSWVRSWVRSLVRFSAPACLPVSRRHGVPCCLLQMIATPRSCRWLGRLCRCWQGGAPCRRRKP
jgi:hypothetical protein